MIGLSESGEEGKHNFLLLMYGFCSNNALYSVSLPFHLQYFSFNYYWELGLLLFQISFQSGVAYKKHVNLFCVLLNIKK